MIEGHRVLQIPTTNGSKIEVEVNYSANEKVNGCKVVKFRFGSVTFDVRREDLMTVMLAIGSESDQKDLMPMKLSTVKKAQRMLGFEWTASRDYHKGEKILVQAPWIDQVVTDDEILSGAFKNRKTVNYGRK